LAQLQIEQLGALLRILRPANPFYSSKYNAAGAPAKTAHLGDFFGRFPFTTKSELAADQLAHPPYGTNLTFPLEQYTRCHQTSGTRGVPLRWLDTAESWDWMLGSWQTVLRVAGVTPLDRLFFAFSFGPFLGFWLAFEAAQRLGCRCLAGGGMSSVGRLRAILDHGATVLCCTPTYALHLGEVARLEGIDLSTSQVRLLIVAGEPGGSIPSTRTRLESVWPGARVFDHHGMTETGPVTFECPARPQVLHVLEAAYIAEIVHPTTGDQLHPGDTGELVLTTLGRTGSPLLRYRTGDLVRAGIDSVCACGRRELALEGGILGRTDDMVVVRGVNLYPSAVEEVLRGLGDVAEYQVQVDNSSSLTQAHVTIEPLPSTPDPAGLARRAETALQVAFSLHIPVTVAPTGTLPRFEMKATRWTIRSP
jgi:phenylacetate-CoA ligase